MTIILSFYIIKRLARSHTIIHYVIAVLLLYTASWFPLFRFRQLPIRVNDTELCLKPVLPEYAFKKDGVLVGLNPESCELGSIVSFCYENLPTNKVDVDCGPLSPKGKELQLHLS